MQSEKRIVTPIAYGVAAVIITFFAVYGREPEHTPILCNETDAATILRSNDWRVRSDLDMPWIREASKSGAIEWQELETLECYEPTHPDKTWPARQFWWKAKGKKSGHHEFGAPRRGEA